MDLSIMKICVLFEGYNYQLRGEFMAIHNRMKYMVKDPDLSISIYVIQRYYDNFTNWIRDNKQIELKKDFYLDGIHYNYLYYKRSYLDYFCRTISPYQTTIEAHRVKRFGKLFSEFDLLFSHSLLTGLLALDLKQKKGIPYVMMWHGSSIHTLPFENKTIFSLTKKVLRNANHNFFVSKELFDIANKIAGYICLGSVSHNGVDTAFFYEYSDEKKKDLAKQLQINIDAPNVAFIGNHIPIKNVQYLPKLFSSIHKKLPETHFHIIGTGGFQEDFKDCAFSVTYWGNQTPENMPHLYNCMDLVVLPSINEGLPMVCLESLACGTAFVGSRVGGIADVAGIDNTVPFSPTFETDFANLCKEKLVDRKTQAIQLPEHYHIDNVVGMEMKVLKATKHD